VYDTLLAFFPLSSHIPQETARESFLGYAVKIHCILCLKINNGFRGVENVQDGRITVASAKMEGWGEVSAGL
jgi:hypothetical protein